MGFLGNKSPTYKTLQGCPRYPYKMIVAWCGVRLGGGREARTRGRVGSHPKRGGGTGPAGCLTQGESESQLGFAQLTWEGRASELDDVLGPSGFSPEQHLFPEPVCKLDEAIGDPEGTAVFSLSDAGASQRLEPAPQHDWPFACIPLQLRPGPFPGQGED